MKGNKLHMDIELIHTSVNDNQSHLDNIYLFFLTDIFYEPSHYECIQR